MTEIYDLQNQLQLLKFISELLTNGIAFEMDFDGEKFSLHFPALPEDWKWVEGSVE